MSPFTLAIIKPDAVANPITLKWISEAMFQSGLHVTKGCRVKMSPDQAARLYAVHKGKFFYSRLIRHVCSGPSIVMRLELIENAKPLLGGGPEWISKLLRLLRPLPQVKSSENLPFAPDEAIRRWRKLLGPSKIFANLRNVNGPISESNLMNLRQYFAVSDTRNVGHGSDSVAELIKEYAIFADLLKNVDDIDRELFELYRFSLPEEISEEEEIFKVLD